MSEHEGVSEQAGRESESGDETARVPVSSVLPGWLPRAYLLAAVTVAALVVTFWMLQQLKGLLTILVVSLFLAFAIEPAVNWLAARGWRRGPATGVVFLGVLVVLVSFVWTLGELVVEQVSSLVDNAPQFADDAVNWINSTFHTDYSGTDIQRKAAEMSTSLEKYVVGLAGDVWGIGTTAVGVLFQALGVLLFTYYFAADGPRFRNAVCSLLPPQKQRHVLRAWDIAVEKTGGYLYSRALLALASTLAHYAAMRVLDLPSAFALALWVGVVSQFIPTVGTYLAGALPVIVALAQSPRTALWILLFIVLYQQFENYVLQPRITATTLDMHPAVAFGAVLAGAALFGATGALLAIPVTATAQAFIGAYIRRYEVNEPTDSLKTGGAQRKPWRERLRRPHPAPARKD
ncbi:pheromone autoinducer 2 transporter [Nocardia otitidiscaviarum]|uniref:Pheromone autoinducer 2 transporter n=1 Tax=Nocardia otitidiscaviarum TaxID=1823 RepID=A0A378YBJ9_9NOCA|nr:AI-2E family transporter [Nocardia otitidiscaviarum]SUA73757.1 pheromone autoinducer 2 transporter [Nocardia otitidiscaviarum]